MEPEVIYKTIALSKINLHNLNNICFKSKELDVGENVGKTKLPVGEKRDFFLDT